MYTLLQRSLQMTNQLDQRDVIVVFDHAIYAKAPEIVLQKPEEFQRLAIWIESFHTICSFMAAIGKRFTDAGLGDILIDSSMVA